MLNSHKISLLAAWVLIPVLTLLSQSLMKILARNSGDMEFGVAWIQLLFTSPWIIALILTEILSFLLWMHVLAKMDVSRAVPLTSISYVLILATSHVIFYEQIAMEQLVGALLILSGVWLISTAPHTSAQRSHT